MSRLLVVSLFLDRHDDSFVSYHAFFFWQKEYGTYEIPDSIFVVIDNRTLGTLCPMSPWTQIHTARMFLDPLVAVMFGVGEDGRRGGFAEAGRDGQTGGSGADDEDVVHLYPLLLCFFDDEEVMMMRMRRR